MTGIYGYPYILVKHKGTKSLAVTKADVGFPGNPNTNMSFSLANVVGLPGFIFSLPKKI